jgi:hypothetical protein
MTLAMISPGSTKTARRVPIENPKSESTRSLVYIFGLHLPLSLFDPTFSNLHPSFFAAHIKAYALPVLWSHNLKVTSPIENLAITSVSISNPAAASQSPQKAIFGFRDVLLSHRQLTL